MFDQDHAIDITAKGGINGIKSLLAGKIACIVCPRTLYDENKTKREFSRGGVYILTWRSTSGVQTINIGQATTSFAQRFPTKQNWSDVESVIVFSGREKHEIDAGMSKYIESCLLEKAWADNYNVENTNASNPPDLTDHKKIRYDEYLNAIKALWPYIGLDTPARKPVTTQESAVEDSSLQQADFYWKIPPRTGYRAWGCWIPGGEFKLLNGSYVRKDVAEHLKKPQYKHVMEHRRFLLTHCVKEKNIYVLSKGDLIFPSVRIAAAVTTGKISNDLFKPTEASADKGDGKK